MHKSDAVQVTPMSKVDRRIEMSIAIERLIDLREDYSQKRITFREYKKGVSTWSFRLGDLAEGNIHY